jgi:putative spermidine/putrescine transport system permease protein
MNQKGPGNATTKKKMKNSVYLLAVLPFLAIVLLYEILPLISMIVSSFGSETNPDVSFCGDNYKNIFITPAYQQAILNSLKITIVSTIFGILIAFIGARAAYISHGKTRNVFIAILNMTSNFAGVPLAFAYMIILGTSGIVIQLAKATGFGALSAFNLYSSSGLTLMYIYFQIPLATLLLIPAFNVIRKEWREANLLLGGSNGRFWFKVGIPMLIPSIFGTINVLFANALAAYATAYALLMYNYLLLPVKISSMFTGDMQMQPHLGAAMSVVMMLIMILAIFLNNYIVKKTSKWEVR